SATAVTKPASRQHELAEPNHHAEHGKAESPSPAELRCAQRHEQRAEERADADTDIEDRKAGIPPCAAFRVQLGDHDTDVGFEEAHAQHDDYEPQEEAPDSPEDQQGV